MARVFSSRVWTCARNVELSFEKDNTHQRIHPREYQVQENFCFFGKIPRPFVYTDTRIASNGVHVSHKLRYGKVRKSACFSHLSKGKIEKHALCLRISPRLPHTFSGEKHAQCALRSKVPNTFSICGVAQQAHTGSTQNMRDKHMLICFSGTCKQKFRIIVFFSLSPFLARFRFATHSHCQTEFAEQRKNNDKMKRKCVLFSIFFSFSN